MRFPRLLMIALLSVAAVLLPAVAAQAQSPACPCTVFGAADGPSGNAVHDAPLELGMKFVSSENGYITALRFYKQANNTGTHVGHLWTASGTQLAEMQFTDETASGWQEAKLIDPVPITAGTTYVVSYYSASGYFANSGGYFSSPAGSGPLTAPAAGNGVYKYGSSSSFPTDTWNATNYWVDAKFERTPPADTRAPRVASTTPADGATGVSVTSSVTATFDEAIDPASVTPTSFQLHNSGGGAISGTTSYNAGTQTATFTPSAA